MSDETQALCFLAGANSIFYGEKLLTTENPAEQKIASCSNSWGSAPEELATRLCCGLSAARRNAGST